jgi:iron complex transport system ATP-binding protein
MHAIDVESATFAYQPQRPIFTNISFHLQPGEIFCIVGPNGCGKTTLLDCILGWHVLDSGQIRLQGLDMRHIKPRAKAAAIAYVPQRHSTAFPFTVLDIVLMGRTHATGLCEAPSARDRDLARAALEQIGLAHFASRPYTQLSGGELQLVLIARALAQQAGIIIMDEPTAHLDFRHELNVLETIVDLVRDHQRSILMSTHSLNQAFYLENAAVPTRVALMADGHIYRVGKPAEVLTEQNLEEVFGLRTRIYCLEENGLQTRFIMPVANKKNTPRPRTLEKPQ